MCGGDSYPTLLVHPVAVYSVISWVGVRDNISTVQFVGLTVATTAASVALGTLYYACFEYHWLVSKLWYRVRGADYRDLHIADATSASVAGSAAKYVLLFSRLLPHATSHAFIRGTPTITATVQLPARN